MLLCLPWVNTSLPIGYGFFQHVTDHNGTALLELHPLLFIEGIPIFAVMIYSQTCDVR